MDKHKQLVEVLERNFGIAKFDNELDSESEYLKKIQLILSDRIAHLINTDMEKLLQILYKIDVHQSHSDKAFELGEVQKISMQLAEDIINRQLRKIDYAREFYQKK